MSDQIHCTLTHDPRLLRQALFFPMKKYFWRTTVITAVLVCVVTLVTTIVFHLLFSDTSPRVMFAALFAFYGYILFANIISNPVVKEAIEQTRIANETHSPTKAEFGPDGLAFRNSVLMIEAAWDFVFDVFELESGTGFQYAGSISTVPDSDLPKGMTGKAFRAKIAEWRRP